MLLGALAASLKRTIITGKMVITTSLKGRWVMPAGKKQLEHGLSFEQFCHTNIP